MAIVIQVLLWVISSHLLNRWLHWGFWTMMLATAILYLVVTRGHGLTGGGFGVIGGIGDMFHTLYRFAVSLCVWVAVMMLANRIVEIPFRYVFDQFGLLGFRFWLWPWHIAIPLLLSVCIAFLVAGLAGEVARGNTKGAAKIFAIGAAVTGVLWIWPEKAKQVLPTDRHGNVSLRAADKTVVREGVVPPLTRGVYTSAFGPLPDEGIFPAVGHWFLKVGFGVKRGKANRSNASSSHAQVVSYTPPATTIEVTPSYPSLSEGTGVATVEDGLRIWAYPGKSWIHATLDGEPADVKYCREDDLDVCWADVPGASVRKWERMKPGYYIVCPLVEHDVEVSWGIQQ